MSGCNAILLFAEQEEQQEKMLPHMCLAMIKLFVQGGIIDKQTGCMVQKYLFNLILQEDKYVKQLQLLSNVKFIH